MNKKTYRILALVLALAMGLGVAGIALAWLGCGLFQVSVGCCLIVLLVELVLV